MMKNRLFLFFLCASSLVVFACTSAKPTPEPRSESPPPESDELTCSQPSEPKPAWINGDNSDLLNYQAAADSAPPSPSSKEPNYDRARTIAIVKLASELKIRVASSFDLIVKHSGGETNRESEQNIRTRSNLDLNDVEDRGRWVDPVSCRAWVRVALVRETADELVKLQTAVDDYEKAKDASQTLKARLDSVHSALKQFESILFERLPKKPSQRFYTERAAALRKELEIQTIGKYTVMMILRADQLEVRHYQQILSKFISHSRYEGNNPHVFSIPCLEVNACLNKARSEKAVRLVLIAPRLNVREASSAGYIGTLTAHATEYNVSKDLRDEASSFFMIGSEFALYADQLVWDTAIFNMK